MPPPTKKIYLQVTRHYDDQKVHVSKQSFTVINYSYDYMNAISMKSRQTRTSHHIYEAGGTFRSPSKAARSTHCTLGTN